MCCVVFCMQFPIIYQGETRIADDKRTALYEAFALLETFLADGPYVAGTAQPTLADIYAMATMSSIVVSAITHLIFGSYEV